MIWLKYFVYCCENELFNAFILEPLNSFVAAPKLDVQTLTKRIDVEKEKEKDKEEGE